LKDLYFQVGKIKRRHALSSWHVFQKYIGGKRLSSKEMSEMYKAAGVKERFKSLVDAEQGTTEHILHDRDGGLHIPPPTPPRPVRSLQSAAEPESKSDTPADLGGLKKALRGLSDKSGLQTLNSQYRACFSFEEYLRWC
jgi:hypothetical protein